MANKKMLKTYHSLQKTPIDNNTVFYASLDSTTTAETGQVLNLGTGSFKPMPTGLGYKFNGDSITPVTVNGIDINQGTIDFIVDTVALKNDNPWANPLAVFDNNNNVVFNFYFNNGRIYFNETYSDGSISPNPYYLISNIQYVHVRVSWNATSIYYRVNGVLISTITRKTNTLWRTPFKVQIGGNLSISNNYCKSAIVADVSISNIDRGTYFPTLPKDFIDGTAIISPAFNSQRKINADPLTSQYTVGIAKSMDTNRPKQQTVTQAVAGQWTSPTAQVMQNTVTGTISTAGNSTVIVTANGMTGSPVTVNVAVALSDTASAVAGKIVTALQGNTNINNFFTISNSSAVLTLTAKTIASYDATMNISVANGTCVGLTTSNATITTQGYLGDTIAIKGLGGEILSGVIDSDTALARVIGTLSNVNVIPVDDVSKLVVGDTVSFYDLITFSSFTKNITAIDSVNKTFTIDVGTITNTNGYMIFETTPSSSSPLVKTNLTGTAQAGGASTITLPSTFSAVDSTYNTYDIMITSGTGSGQRRTISAYVGATKVATVSSAWTTNPDNTSVFVIYNFPVTGTWTNLGTNQATFTLGANSLLTTQDLQIEYSLNMIAGQGGMPEALTTTLGGEINAKIYDPSFTNLTTDFNVKISGSVVENPNIARRTTTNSAQTTLATPSALGMLTEFTDVQLPDIYSLNNACRDSVTNVNLQIPQQLFSFDLIALVERKYGTIPASTVAGKVTWLKNNLNSITCNWYGYGSNPTGNKANLNGWLASSSGYASAVSHTLASVSSLVYSIFSSNAITNPTNTIDSNGFVNFIAYTDASDGVTASTINTDYISLNVQLKYEARQTLTGVPYNSSVRKLVNGTVAVRDDFSGKISGSTVENPNIARLTVLSTNLMSPSAGGWAELLNGVAYNGYGRLVNLDSTSVTSSTTVLNVIPQQLFSFNLIRMIEDKFGVIPALDKVTWLKNNINSITCNWYGYGSCPSGNSAYLDSWACTLNSWNAKYYGNSNLYKNSTSSIANVKYITTVPSAYIDPNGFFNALAYTDASAGTSTTSLWMTGHGLSNNDVVENASRGNYGSGSIIVNGNYITHNTIAGQIAGDTINKYHYTGSTKTAGGGSTTTNLVITAHGLSTGDYIWNSTRGGSVVKVTVVDANTLTCNTAITGQVSGDTIYLYHLLGTQLAEGTTTTQISITGHGLNAWDMIENTTVGKFRQINAITTNSVQLTSAVTGQNVGDTIRKYHQKVNSVNVGNVSGTTVALTNHGLFTGDCIMNNTRGASISEITVIDVNTFTVNTAITGMATGDSITTFNYFGTQTAESGVASTIYTDYIYLDVTLNTPTGYDVLVPENPMRTDGQSNVVLVRKETKEIQTMFNTDNENNIITYGDYTPTPSVLTTTEPVIPLAGLKDFIVSTITSATANQISSSDFIKRLYRTFNANDVTLVPTKVVMGYLNKSTDTANLKIGSKINIDGLGITSSNLCEGSVQCVLNNFRGIAVYLVNHKGELKLWVFNKTVTNGLFDVDHAGLSLLIPITNRPLIQYSDVTLETTNNNLSSSRGGNLSTLVSTFSDLG